MKVLLYQGGHSLVKESGVGRALTHQEAALQRAGVVFTGNPQETYDVVHINTVLPDARHMAARARRQGKKVVWHGHSTMEDFRNSFAGTNLAAPLFKRWICSCYDSADLVLTPSEYARKILSGYGLHVPVVPVSNGVDTGFFRKDPSMRHRFRKRWRIAETQKTVLCVGLPIERKGILDVIALARALPEYLFFWCGHASAALLPQKIRTAIRNAPSNLCFAGFLDREALRDAYGGRDLFFFPTQEETEGIVMLEALAMEIPVLVRDIPVYESWLQDGVQVYKADGLPAFRRSLEAILENKVPDLTKAGRKIAEERDLAIIGAILANLYQTLV